MDLIYLIRRLSVAVLQLVVVCCLLPSIMVAGTALPDGPLVCFDAEIFLDETGNVVLTVDEVAAHDESVLIPSITDFDCEDLGENTVSVNAPTGSSTGGDTTCVVTVMVRDAISPVLLCPSPVEIPAEGNNCLGIISSIPIFEWVDNCGGTQLLLPDEVELIDGELIEGSLPLGTYTNDYRYEDASGNADTCTYIVEVVDIFPPQLTCRDTVIYLDETGQSLFSNTVTDIGFAFDFCGPVTEQAISLTFDCGAVDTIALVPYTVFDQVGFSANCIINLTVQDTTKPIITLGVSDTTLYLDENGMAFLEIEENADWATDNCGVQDVQIEPFAGAAAGAKKVVESSAGKSAARILSFTCDDVGNQNLEVAIEVTDVNGNITLGSLFVTVLDTIAPKLICHSDTTVYLDAAGMASVDFAGLIISATDNCAVVDTTAMVVDYSCAEVTSTAVVLSDAVTISDASGLMASCAIAVSVLDTVAPALTCRDTTIALDENGENAFAIGDLVSSTDACPPTTMVGNPLAVYTCAEVGSPIVSTQTRTDANGNSASCQVTLTVIDTLKPVVSTLDQSGILSDEDGTFLVDSAAAVTSIQENCTISSVVFSRPLLFTCADIGESEVVVTATDASGNVGTSSFTVSIGFNQPRFSCIGDLNVVLDENCQAELIPAMLLRGNTACLSAFSFAITVMDDDPTNGAIIDGCGSFPYTITSTGTGLFDLNFTGCWGTVNAEDKTSPSVVTTPDNVELLCVDLNENNLTTLLANVSKCYEVTGAGVTIPGTMHPGLRARLQAGGTTPLLPTFTDGCAERIEVCVADVVTYDAEDPQCNSVVITRTFTATEMAVCTSATGEENPSVTTSYQLEFVRPTLADLSGEGVDAVVHYERCGAVGEPFPVPRPDDYPSLLIGDRELSLINGQAVCNIGVTYEDGNPTITCPYTYKFVRTYTVIDWCNPSEVRTFTQVVKVGDTTNPVFFGPTQDRDFDGEIEEDLVYSTNAGNACAAYIRLDAPGVRATDNCSGNTPPLGGGGPMITAQIYPGADLTAAPIGLFIVDPDDGDAEISSAIPLGNHLLRYTATDDCGNITVSDHLFSVVDGTAPIAICEGGLNVGVTSGSVGGGPSTGIAVLTPDMLDNGSYDDCSEVTLAIARVNAANTATEIYDEELILTCADIGTVRVGLRVTDAVGNENFCWLDVLVEDKNIPTCIPPSPVRLSCLEYNSTLPADIQETTVAERNAIFGAATGVDNCEVTISETISGDVNSCGVGSFTRTFTATDGAGFTNAGTCRQRITVYGIHDYQLIFPTDEEGECADIPEFTGVTANELACDLITTTADVDTLRTLEAGEECFKLRITYDVINWCEYNTLGQPYLIPRDGGGIRNPETQLLYLNVIPEDFNTTTDDFAFLSRFSDRNYNPGTPQRDKLVDDGNDNDGSDDDNGNDNIDDDVYAADDSRGHFRYLQFVKIYDDVAPTITTDEPADCFSGVGENCEANVTLTFTATDECSDITPGLELDANYVAADGFTADNPVTLGIGISLSDGGAGNFTITATGVPVGNHAIRIRASDGCGNFDVEIFEFCVVPDKAPSPICIATLTVTLMPDGQGGGMAEIWANDFIASDVLDCFGNLIDKYSIYTEEEANQVGFAPVAGRLGLDFTCEEVDTDIPVRVYAIADVGTADYCSVIVQVQASQADICVEGGSLAGRIATANDAGLEGVRVSLTGNDMDEITLTEEDGIFSFVDLDFGIDYTLQADYLIPVNLQRVKTSDVVKMANVILGAETFDTDYDYLAGDVNNDQELNILDMVAIQRVILGLDDAFVGGASWGFVPANVDISDPYASEFPNVYNVNNFEQNVLDADMVGYELGNVISNGRSATSLKIEDIRLEVGQRHRILLAGAGLAGFQGTLKLAAGLELIETDYTGQGALNLNHAEEGLIAVALRNNPSLTLEVRATEAGLLSELVELTDAITVREGVSLTGAAGGLSLAFTNNMAPASAQNVLMQNTPNPVAGETIIRYELVRGGFATLTVQDVAGRLILTRQLTTTRGTNQLRLTSTELGGATGLLTYTLTAGPFSATRKMVVVR